MSEKNVTFMGTCGRGMGLNLKIVKDYLVETIDDIEIQYFIKNEKNNNSWKRRAAKAAKEDFLDDIANVICQDKSLSKEDVISISGKRIFLMNCFDYFFREKLENSEGLSKESKKDLSGFSHIIVTSPFCKEFLQLYNTDDITVIDNVCLPLGNDMCRMEKQNEIRDKIEFYYPFIKNKKILSIIVAGKKKEKENTYLEKDSLEKILRHIDNNWIILTNCNEVFEVAGLLSAKYSEKICYVNKLIQESYLLYISDALVTNDGMRATCYATKQKPVYCIDYKNNNFEKYMKSFFPQLYLDSFIKIASIDLENTSLHKKFFKSFSYLNGRNACEIIKELLVASE